ncbi:IS5 family transposase [Desulfococcaceae bacterium HSG7]|nr:IS5 family transposase [Desulfococcaceae bacterium HSG7]
MSGKELSDIQWNEIKDHPPPETGRRWPPAKCDRLMVNTILRILRTGAPWRDPPASYGPWNTVYTRFNRWSEQGVWRDILDILSFFSDDEARMPDDSVIRAHQHAAGAAGGQVNQVFGCSVGGFSTKTHAPVDAPGYPVDIRLTAGQAHDSVPAKELLENQPAEYVTADRAYDSDEPVSFIISQGGVPVIPSRRCRWAPCQYDRHIYKERCLVVIFFNKIKHYQRVAIRYEKPAADFLRMVLIAGCMVWIGF